MRISMSGRLVIAAGVISLAAAAAVAAAAPVQAKASSPAAAATSFTISGELDSVAAVSASDAWAVGYSDVGGKDQTLLVHWNGKTWTQVTNPKPVSGGTLDAVTAASADNVWAVGVIASADDRDQQDLVMHWNGKTWSRQTNVPTLSGTLNDVAVSGSTVWAVGGVYEVETPALPAVLHQTGGRWYVVPSPSSVYAWLTTVAAGSSSTWAAGVAYAASDAVNGDLLMRWSGTSWQVVTSYPLHGAADELTGLAEGPGGAVWAVGYRNSDNVTSYTPTSMLWNGKSWQSVAVPASSGTALHAVGFVPGGTAWAVGVSQGKTFIARWTGKTWARVSSPSPGTPLELLDQSGGLQDVAATSASNAWAVGAGYSDTYILHWNGKTWS